MYNIISKPATSVAAFAGAVRRASISGRQIASVLLPSGEVSTGTRGQVATAKRSATRNGVFHPEADRVWEVLDTDKNVIGTFTAEVGTVYAVEGADYIRAQRPIAGTDDAEIDAMFDELFSDADSDADSE